MLLPKKIRSLLNGGAAAAGVEGLKSAIETISAEAAAFRCELAEIPARRGQAALADDAVMAMASLKAREDELYAALEVAEIRLAALREKLPEQTDFRRRDRIEHHRREAREKFEALASALRAACDANEAATAAYEAAVRELGAGDAFSLVSRGSYLPPGAVVRAMVDHWEFGDAP